MAEEHGWIAKDKYGDFWYGSFSLSERGARERIKGEWSKQYEFKIVKVKFVEVK